MEDASFDYVLDEFSQAGASMRCKRVGVLLSKLGFEVRDGKRGGHKIYVHPDMPNFMSSGYNCDHGRNPEVKRAYITKIIRVLKDHEADIRCWLAQRTD